MIVSIHQPNYIPYLGFFDKMLKSDIFVLLDDAQYSKGDYHNRNRIKTIHGAKWLTIPVKAEFKPIKEILINKELKFSKMDWNFYHLHLLKENYKKTKYYDKLIRKLSELYSEDYGRLIDVNLNMLKFLREQFNINAPIYFSSALKLKSRSTQKLVDICKHFEADKYLSGKDGPKYMDIKLFDTINCEVIVQNFNHPTYDQQFNGFLPYLSSLDAVLNTVNIFKDLNEN